MPTISEDGLTYTFQIRNDFAFSPPASGVVTAQSMKYTFERTLSHEMASPASQFFTNIVGERRSTTTDRPPRSPGSSPRATR